LYQRYQRHRDKVASHARAFERAVDAVDAVDVADVADVAEA
jgi:hypothetical protein